MSTHTKGPWKVTKALCPDRNEWVIEIQSDEDFVADVKIQRSEVSQANAALISAAPEMLEAMNMLACELAHFEKHGQRSNNYDWICDLYKKALAKARGEK